MSFRWWPLDFGSVTVSPKDEVVSKCCKDLTPPWWRFFFVLGTGGFSWAWRVEVLGGERDAWRWLRVSGEEEPHDLG